MITKEDRMEERYVSKELLLSKIDAVLAMIWERLDDKHKKGLTPPPDTNRRYNGYM